MVYFYRLIGFANEVRAFLCSAFSGPTLPLPVYYLSVSLNGAFAQGAGQRVKLAKAGLALRINKVNTGQINLILSNPLLRE